jgi:hypothetical protein
MLGYVLFFTAPIWLGALLVTFAIVVMSAMGVDISSSSPPKKKNEDEDISLAAYGLWDMTRNNACNNDNMWQG